MAPREVRLLLLDGDPSAIRVMAGMLSQYLDQRLATSSSAALRLAHELTPDHIVLDVDTPGMSGLDVCKTLKAQAAFRHVSIAFITRFSDPHNEMRALGLGAANVIPKPHTRAIPKAPVRKLLDLKRRTDAELELVRDQLKRVGEAPGADIIGAASDAIAGCDAEDRVVLINAAACSRFGTKPMQAMGPAIRAMLGEDALTDNHAQNATVRITITRASGECFPTEMSASGVRRGIGLRDHRDAGRHRRPRTARGRITFAHRAEAQATPRHGRCPTSPTRRTTR